jgi:hypothetical protein
MTKLRIVGAAMTLEISPQMVDDLMVSLPVVASWSSRPAPQIAVTASASCLRQHPEISQHR